jgi:hypothetical protein
VRKAVDIIKAGVSQINDPKLTSRLLTMRRHRHPDSGMQAPTGESVEPIKQIGTVILRISEVE